MDYITMKSFKSLRLMFLNYDDVQHDDCDLDVGDLKTIEKLS